LSENSSAVPTGAAPLDPLPQLSPSYTGKNSRCAGEGRAGEGRGVQKGGLNQTVNYGGRHCCVSSAFLPPKVRRLTPKTTKNCRLC